MYPTGQKDKHLLRASTIDPLWLDQSQRADECHIQCLDIMRPSFELIASRMKEGWDVDITLNRHIHLCSHLVHYDEHVPSGRCGSAPAGRPTFE